MHSRGARKPSELRPQMSINPPLTKLLTRHHTNEGALTSSAGVLMKGSTANTNLSHYLWMAGAMRVSSIKKEVIKREGISLAEAQKKAEWSKLVNNNLQVWQQCEPVNIMHYQYSSWISLNRITNRDKEMESQK